MSFVNLLAICLTVIISFSAVTSIFVNGWVKASHITELKANTAREFEVIRKFTEEQFKLHRAELDKLWEKLVSVDVIASKLEDVKSGVDRLERMLINGVEKRSAK